MAKMGENKNFYFLSLAKHLIFYPSANQVHVGYFLNGTLYETNYDSVPNSIPANSTTEGEFGFEVIDNDSIRVFYNGRSFVHNQQGIGTYNGRYAIFEPMGQAVVSMERPAFEGCCECTGFYVSCESGIYLRDNFHRADGSIGVAPTGHVYQTYRAWTSDSEEIEPITKYDYVWGQNN